MPKSLRHVINGFDQLAEAFEIGCTGIKKTTAGIDECVGQALSIQKARMLAELAKA
jgi:hypothetical protein